MIDNQANIENTIGSNRGFGIVFGSVFLLLSIFLYLNTHSYFIIFFVISIAFFIAGIFFPEILRIPNKYWFKFGLLLGHFVSFFIMILLFYFIFTSIGIVLRVTSRIKSMNAKKESYWIPNEPISTMEDQF